MKDKDHLKVQNDRRHETRWARSEDNQNPAKKAGTERLRDSDADLQPCNGSGVPDCKAWIRRDLIDDHGIDPTEVPR